MMENKDYMKRKKYTMTMKEMCEIIVESGILRKPDGTSPTAREVFDYSPSGELSMVLEWFDTAMLVLAARNAKS